MPVPLFYLKVRATTGAGTFPLPRYAPELNTAETIWEYLRKNKLANTVFDSYDDIVDKVCQAWLFFADDKTSVTAITTRDWATVT